MGYTNKGESGGLMTKINKKGFTLIELLAVIVILGIIFLIAVPVFNNVITRARYGAFGSSKKNIERAAELYYVANVDKIVWDNDISYIEIGELKNKKYLKKNVVNLLNNMSITDDTKILLYKKGRDIEYSLQLYNEDFFSWYQEQMIKGSKKNKDNLPINIGDKRTVELDTLMDKGLTDELRLPLDLDSRCVGYVEIEKTGNNDYNYDSYVDCLTEASTFSSHYVSYGGKYLDEFLDVKETSDGGYIAVGKSNSEIITKYGIGNNGKYDAIIVKFTSDGTVSWAKNFGGSNNDIFFAIVELVDGYVAVGTTYSDDIDIVGYNGGSSDALIVKYNKQGDVIYKKCYGGSGRYELFKDIIIDGEDVVVIGSVNGSYKTGDLEGAAMLYGNKEGIIIKYDKDFNVKWRSFFTGTGHEEFESIIKTSDNHYVIAGQSNSNDYDMEGIGYNTANIQYELMIWKYDVNGNLINKKVLHGSRNDYYNDLVEVFDGYIAVGFFSSFDDDMSDLSKASNGFSDALIVKYDKNLDNVMWKKSFGGTDSESFSDVDVVNDEVVAIGFSKSSDMDMNDLVTNNNGYSKAIIVKFNVSNGNIVSKKIFGGTNSDIFTSIAKTNNGFVTSGSTYSNDINLKNFNKGHQDAILVNYDNNLNLKKSFQEPVVLIDKLKTITVNYGTSFSFKYDNIYTTNDPTKDLLEWCTANEPYKIGNTSNYYYGGCLIPYNSDNMKLLTELEVNNGLRMHVGEYDYPVTTNPDNTFNWHMLIAYNSGGGGDMGHSNLKLKFIDGYVGHITDAINKGYIEPLVIVHSSVYTSRPSALFPTVIDIINENGSTGLGSYPILYIHIKPKKVALSSVSFSSTRNSRDAYDGFKIYELRNFDMSITPTN